MQQKQNESFREKYDTQIEKIDFLTREQEKERIHFEKTQGELYAQLEKRALLEDENKNLKLKISEQQIQIKSFQSKIDSHLEETEILTNVLEREKKKSKNLQDKLDAQFEITASLEKEIDDMNVEMSQNENLPQKDNENIGESFSPLDAYSYRK